MVKLFPPKKRLLTKNIRNNVHVFFKIAFPRLRFFFIFGLLGVGEVEWLSHHGTRNPYHRCYTYRAGMMPRPFVGRTWENGDFGEGGGGGEGGNPWKV